MSYGTCRERQTFVWACETALDEYPQVMNKYFKGPLETLVVPKKRGGASRSLAHDKAVDILYRCVCVCACVCVSKKRGGASQSLAYDKAVDTLHWHIFIYGQRNYALTKITNENTLLYYLDEDNIIHPDLYNLLNYIDNNTGC